MRLRLMIIVLMTAALGAAPGYGADSDAGSNAVRRPNIVFVMTDDQARWAVGAYGNPEVKTPNLDRLARDGALFLNAFTATPVCSPSRASFMTSLYPTEFGIYDWINHKVEPDLGLAPSAITWPELLKANGYATAFFGKWHLGREPRFHPTRAGFDHFYGFLEGGNQPINPTLEVEGQTRKVEGAIADLIVDDAIRWLDARHAARNAQPFLLTIHFREPHAPYAPTPEIDSVPFANLDPTLPKVEGLPTDRVKTLYRQYYASVHSVDRNVGRVLDQLDRLKLTDDTIVIFASDHGYMIGHHGLHHKGNASWLLKGKTGHRPNMFDDSIRIPLIVRWPGVVKPGARIADATRNIDLFPTILDMTGLGVPANLNLRGRSVVRQLRGETVADWDQTVFGQYDMHHTQNARMRMIRTPRWKLIRHFEPNAADELYDLANDPGELDNLIDSQAPTATEAKRDLGSRLDAWRKGIGDLRNDL